MKKHRRIQALLSLILAFACLSGCGAQVEQPSAAHEQLQSEAALREDIPEYEGEPYVELNGNVPQLPQWEEASSFEQYEELDDLGRCQRAFACVGSELMPTQERGSIGMIKPSGWHTVRYDHVDGQYLYNRCHLIAYQLTAENANARNLITGTRYMNTEGMLPFEQEVADYVKSTGNHVLYEVTPIFADDDLVARGVHIQAESIEDEGAGVQFNVFVFNVQPGVEIDYATGESRAIETEEEPEQAQTEGKIRGNRRSKIYHCPGQAAYEDMADSDNLILFDTEEEAQAAGYRRAKR